MKSLPRFFCLAAAVYLIGDAFIFKGPVSRWLHAILTPSTDHLAARVSGHAITRSQLDRALADRLWLEGKSAANLTSTDLKTSRAAALHELIDHELLRLQVKEVSPQISVSEAEIDAQLRGFSSRFETKSELANALKSQGIGGPNDLRPRLAARIRQEKLIARRIAPAVAVTEGEMREWFDANKDALSQPERVEARHLFIPTLDHPPEQAKLKLDAALLELTEKKKDFATLAKELSEDPATKESGGTLGWISRNRLPADFSAPVFSMEVNQPKLIRTKLGWHLVEITAPKPAEPRAFEQAKPEILAALEAQKRRQAVKNFRKSLRASHPGQIEVFEPF